MGLASNGATGLHPRDGWLLTASYAICALMGCASQGPLRPPSLHLPAQVRGLAADRVGDAVDLRWTAPTRTTDGLPLSGKHVPMPLQAEICREEFSAIGCLPLGRVAAGAASARAPMGSFHDVLPPQLSSGPPRLLYYRVRMLNGRGKGATAATAEALAGAAPAALQHVQATPAAGGVLLRWQPVPPMENGRILLRVRRGDPATDAAGEGQPQPGLERARSADNLLSVEAKTADPAGTLDTGAKPGIAQRYSLARERTVRISGKDLSMSGPPVVVLVAADAKLPPVAPPAGLEAVANTLGAPEIDLVWQPEAAASGYRVFRAEGAGTPALLTQEPVRSLTYTDTAVRPGAQYQYSVSSVGRDGVAGPRGSEVIAGVPGR